MATGGGDARVQIWEDCTLQDKAEAAEEEGVTLLKQQRLSNALQVLPLHTLHKERGYKTPSHPLPHPPHHQHHANAQMKSPILQHHL